jgi:hypothetical protein
MKEIIHAEPISGRKDRNIEIDSRELLAKGGVEPKEAVIGRIFHADKDSKHKLQFVERYDYYDYQEKWKRFKKHEKKFCKYCK